MNTGCDNKPIYLFDLLEEPHRNSPVSYCISSGDSRKWSRHGLSPAELKESKQREPQITTVTWRRMCSGTSPASAYPGILQAPLSPFTVLFCFLRSRFSDFCTLSTVFPSSINLQPMCHAFSRTLFLQAIHTVS